MRNYFYAAIVGLSVAGAIVAADIREQGSLDGSHVELTSAVSRPTLDGDDNGDGIIDEDESGWDCETMGNLDCGPIPEDTTVCRAAFIGGQWVWLSEYTKDGLCTFGR
jgi:hypothetical protein